MTTEPPAAAYLPARRQRPRSPSRVLEEAEEQWIFTERELDNTPSIRDGMTAEKEREVRARGVNFIRQVGIMLKLPELTLSTAALFFHRFLMRVTLVSTKAQKALHHYSLGATALFLATKVEECCRKMKELVVACCRVAQKNPNLLVDDQSKDFWKWRDTILVSEDILLETLCFDLTVEAPHKQLYTMLKNYRLEHHKPLRNSAWAFVTDSLITQLCLLCPSRTIAAAALYAAARMYNVQIPDDTDGRPWWESQRVELKNMIKAANYMVKAYEAGQPGGDKASGGAGGGGAFGVSGIGVASAGAPEGSQSIYVGLLADFDAESARTDGESPVWDRTRLKSEKQDTIPTPPRLTIEQQQQQQQQQPDSKTGTRVANTRQPSAESQTGQKRALPSSDKDNETERTTRRDAASSTGAEQDSVAKRRKTDEVDSGAAVNGKAAQPVGGGPEGNPQDTSPRAGELSEEGEVEE